jgi:hypothetical protein
MKDKPNHVKRENIISWMFVVLFFVIGVLNLILVHPVPAIFYILISIVYLPSVNVFLKTRLGFAIPLWSKVVIGLVILWGTLAVGDLAEMLGL